MGRTSSYLHEGKSVSVEAIDDIELLVPRHETSMPTFEFLESIPKDISWENLKGTEIENIGHKQYEALVNLGCVFRRKGLPSAVEESYFAVASGSNIKMTDVFSLGKMFKDTSGKILVSTGDLCLKLDSALKEGKAEAYLKKENLAIIEAFSFAPNVFEVQASEGADLFEVLQELNARDEVVWAEPSWIEYLFTDTRHSGDENGTESSVDPGIPQQWQWSTTRVDQAWKHTEGEGVRVAVIDRGFDVEHEDSGMVSNLSGYFDFGVNPAFSRVDNTPHALFPVHSHGTACAGLIGAKRSNPHGGSGAAPKCELMLIACLKNKWGKQKTLAKAIAYAVNPGKEFSGTHSKSGADIISCSFSLGENPAWKMNPILKKAIEFATRCGRGGKGSAIFWPTGNGTGSLLDNELLNHNSVIGVGQSGADDRVGNYSFGPGLEFLAPGRSVYTTIPENKYENVSGTSFAAPCAAGIAALVLSLNPELRWDELRGILRQSCVKAWCQEGSCQRDSRTKYYGYGRLDALEAINLTIQKRKGMPME